MITLENRLIAFDKLGSKIASELNLVFEQKESELNEILIKSEQKNRWFVRENLLFALEAWADLLKLDRLRSWTSPYQYSEKPQKIGVIQAGNIPLVGFHDFLSVLISGHHFVGKLSSKDEILPVYLSDKLIEIEPVFTDYISWESRLTSVDAIIATGSDNSARYFEYYFGNKPNIIRKNRSSWAIISGNETKEELALLGEDIFRYYGLGCRNLSKLFVPENYDFTAFFEAIEPYNWVYNNNKYANNYDYNQSIYLLNQVPFLQNGFLILKEDILHHSPLSVLFYEMYRDVDDVVERIKNTEVEIQCVSDQKKLTELSVPFGQAQKPGLNDYADNIDTLEWLSHLT
jgi:hypothetical protein